MTLKQVIQHEKLYVELFSKTIDTSYGYEAEDLNQRDKYYHNYLDITQDIASDKDIKSYITKTQKHGFSVIRLENGIKINPSFYENEIVDCDGYYGNDITSIIIHPKSSITIERVNPQNDDPFFDFLYEDSKAYGETYALGNVKRQKEVLTHQSSQYMYFKAVENNQTIGTLNVFMHGDNAKLDDFAIAEEKQRKGFGSQLMYEVLQFLKTQGITYVYLVTDQNGTAKNMYQTWGFKALGTFEVIRIMANQNKS
ncbi:MAG: GNAT family N-acetyltransferase [Acholeplasmataceae bacterium]|jgi:spore maturation protein CgeE|nr:GNAT family N-acetyltransferase [Acholeplasmataceae bacterium]